MINQLMKEDLIDIFHISIIPVILGDGIKLFEKTGEGMLARAFCHEIDHLDGILFIDRVKPVNN